MGRSFAHSNTIYFVLTECDPGVIVEAGVCAGNSNGLSMNCKIQTFKLNFLCQISAVKYSLVDFFKKRP